MVFFMIYLWNEVSQLDASVPESWPAALSDAVAHELDVPRVDLLAVHLGELRVAHDRRRDRDRVHL
jgi:hypothetical protein